jgi:hypothetical protein
MVTDRQVRRLFELLLDDRAMVRAARLTDMDEKTARKYRDLGQLPSEVGKAHDWATRPNPFEAVWGEVLELLEGNAGLQAKTVFGELQRRHPGRFADTQLRTLQRHIKRWRGESGPAKEVFFTQVHEPGRLGASDFTSMNDLAVTIAGQRFDHMVYHFVLTYSNWETATICFSESFESLSEGLQNALWKLGAAPARHRTDRMSLAVNNASDTKEFTQRYRSLLTYYRMTGEKIQAGKGNENGDIEQRHHRFKQAVDQSLMLRGGRDFGSRVEYDLFLKRLLDQLNAGRRGRLAEELGKLGPLPARRLEACKRVPAKVDTSSLIHVERNNYSVPSRLIGESVDVRMYVEHLEVWYGQQMVERLPRLRGRDKSKVNYRHIIDWLVRKPGAFAQYRYRADLFPSSVFRMAYDDLLTRQSTYADKEYLRILHLAARQSESQVEAALRELLASEQPISASAVEVILGNTSPSTNTYQMLVDGVQVELVDLTCFDVLFADKEVQDDSGESGNREGTLGSGATGVAPTDGAVELRGAGSSSGSGDAQLRALPFEPVRSGMSGAAPAEDRASAAAIELAAGEDVRDVRPEAFADEGVASGAEPSRGGLRGPQGESAGVWQTGFGEDALIVCVGPGSGAAGTASVVHDVQSLGADAVGGEARSEAEPRAEADGRLRGDVDRRPGLRATEPRGDGSVVHASGGPLRTGQRMADEQLAILEMGSDLQRPDDDGGGHRPLGAPQRDRGIEHAELSIGTCQERQGRRRGIGVSGVNAGVVEEQVREGADGGAWLRFAGRRYAPSTLRCASPHRRGKDLRVPQIVAGHWRSRGNFNCR